MSKTVLRLMIALLLCLMGANALAEDPVPGEYLFDVPPGFALNVTLTKAINGQFTVGGGSHNYVISGTMSKDKYGVYRLHAKLRKPGAPNEGTPVDGRWEAKEGLLVITRILNSRGALHGRFQESAKDPLGDQWVVDDPVIENRGTAQGSAGSITGSVTQDGKSGTGKITISGIPKRVREGDHIKITLTAEASAPASVSAWVNLNNCSSKLITKEDTVTTSGHKLTGTCEFIFQAGSNAYIQISGGVGDPGWSLVTFKFHKSKS